MIMLKKILLIGFFVCAIGAVQEANACVKVNFHSMFSWPSCTFGGGMCILWDANEDSCGESDLTLLNGNRSAVLKIDAKTEGIADFVKGNNLLLQMDCPLDPRIAENKTGNRNWYFIPAGSYKVLTKNNGYYEIALVLKHMR